MLNPLLPTAPGIGRLACVIVTAIIITKTATHTTITTIVLIGALLVIVSIFIVVVRVVGVGGVVFKSNSDQKAKGSFDSI